ncbi:MAG: hypothetical protein WDN76_03555 [Alphaproteobacteria bacterium]
MIGKTALAIAALAALVAASALLVWASGFALYFAFLDRVGPAGAAGIVALVDLFLIVLGFGIARLMSALKHKEEEEEEEEAPPSILGLFGDAIKEKPILTLAVSALTGFAAIKNPSLFRDLIGDILRTRRD